MLGINDEGRNLNVAGSIPDGHSSSVDIGLIVFAMDNGLILHHTVVSVKVLESAQKKTDNTSFWAGANPSVDGATNLFPSPIISDGLTVTSIASATSGPLSVKQEFMPSSSTK